MKYIKIVPRLLMLCICSLDLSKLIFKSSKSCNACVYTRMKRTGTEPQIGRLLPSRQVAFIFCQRLLAQSRMGEELRGDFSHTHTKACLCPFRKPVTYSNLGPQLKFLPGKDKNNVHPSFSGPDGKCLR